MMASMFDVNAVLAAADAARDRKDWSNTARHYRRFQRFRGGEAEIYIQFSNSIKEEHRIDKNLSSYRTELGLGLKNSEIHLQLGRLCKVMSERKDASDSYSCAAVNRTISSPHSETRR
jgi:hypothetical protein